MNRQFFSLLFVLPTLASFWGAREFARSATSQKKSSVTHPAFSASEIGDGRSRSGQASLCHQPAQKGLSKHSHSSQEILETLKAEPDAPASRLAMFESIAQLDASGLLEFLSLNRDSMKDWSGLQGRCFVFAAERLSEIAGEKAADFWLTNPTTLPVDELLAPWACRNPDAFVLWWKSQTSEIQSKSSDVIYALAANSPDAWNRVSALLAFSPVAAKLAYAAQFSPTWTELLQTPEPQFNANQASQYVLALPEGPSREAVLTKLLGDLFSYGKPKELQVLFQNQPELRKSLEQLPEDQLLKLAPNSKEHQKLLPPSVSRTVKDLIQKDPSAAADLALRIPADSSTRRKSLVDAAAALYKTDPEQARRWVNAAALTAEEYQLLTGRLPSGQ
jgi:hypothetical protein